MAQQVRVLSVPVLGRYWLYHAWQEAAVPASNKAVKHWREGANLGERSKLLFSSLQTTGWEKLLKQWRGLEMAKDRTFKSYLYRLAQFVLAREDPQETFLKSIPTQLASLNIVYPSSVSSTSVRRRIRLLTKQRLQQHRSRMIAWSLTSAPLCLLLLTPFPAIPVYYALYRAFSHYQALSGCRSLATAFSHHDAHQLLDMRHHLLDMQTQGHQFDPLGWPTKMLQANSSYSDILAAISPNVADKARTQAEKDQQPLEQAVQPVLQASAELDDIAQPTHRSTSPIDDAAVLQIGSYFGITGLLQHVAKARRQLKLAPQKQASKH